MTSLRQPSTFNSAAREFLYANRDRFPEYEISSSDFLIFGPEFLLFCETHSPERLNRYVTEIRTNYAFVILPIPRIEIRPEFDYKSEYASKPILSSFRFIHELSGDDAANPIVFASDTYCLENGRLSNTRDLQVFPPTTQETANTAVRTWIGSDGLLHKSELACLDYFDRSQVLREGTFLQTTESSQSLVHLFPKLKHLAVGRVVVELARTVLPGRPITDADIGNVGLIEQFHSSCLLYSRNGFYHNDLRPWNVLVDTDSVRLVDFADVSARDQDVSGLPQVAAYIGTVLWMMGKLRTTPSDFESVIRATIDTTGNHRLWSERWLNLPTAIRPSRLVGIDSPSAIAYSLLNEFDSTA